MALRKATVDYGGRLGSPTQVGFVRLKWCLGQRKVATDGGTKLKNDVSCTGQRNEASHGGVVQRRLAIDDVSRLKTLHTMA